MLKFEKKETPVKYPDKFKPGDIAISRVNVNFSDGTKHTIGQNCPVTENNKYYYNVMHQDYDKK